MKFRWLVGAAAALCIAAGSASTAAAAQPDCAGRGVPDSKISIQLWTFAEYIGFDTDAATIERTRTVFAELREMGYRNVEPFTLSGLSAEAYRDLLDEYGLKASARHVDVGTPANPADIDQILADNKTLGIHYFGSGSTPIFPPIYTTEAEWVAYAEYLNALGARARKAGQTLFVHNHDVEFETVFGGRTVFDILMAHTDPKNVAFQLDLYWAANGGGIGEPARRDRALRQPHPAVPCQGHGGRAVPGPDRDRRRGRSSTSRRSSPRPVAARSTTSSSTTRASATRPSTRSRPPRRASTTSTA